MFAGVSKRLFSSVGATVIENMNLTKVVKVLENFAPSSLAGSWDNVGLLIEPRQSDKAIKKIMLTNDLTESVMDESLSANVDMIISYHPPIFRPLKRLTSKSWKVSKALDSKFEHSIESWCHCQGPNQKVFTSFLFLFTGTHRP